jgi:hypothetical protein
MSSDNINDLSENFKNIDIRTSSLINYRSTHLSYFGIITKPSKDSTSPDMLNSERIKEILLNEIHLNVSSDNIKKLKNKNELANKIIIQSYRQMELPEQKPNLLMSICSILYNSYQDILHNNIFKLNLSKENLILSLSEYDIITSRNPLKKIMSSLRGTKSDWSIFVYKPIENGPLLIERDKGYELITIYIIK